MLIVILSLNFSVVAIPHKGLILTFQKLVISPVKSHLSKSQFLSFANVSTEVKVILGVYKKKYEVLLRKACGFDKAATKVKKKGIS